MPTAPWIIALMLTLWMLHRYGELPSGCAMCGGKHRHADNCPHRRP